MKAGQLCEGKNKFSPDFSLCGALCSQLKLFTKWPDVAAVAAIHHLLAPSLLRGALLTPCCCLSGSRNQLVCWLPSCRPCIFSSLIQRHTWAETFDNAGVGKRASWWFPSNPLSGLKRGLTPIFNYFKWCGSEHPLSCTVYYSLCTAGVEIPMQMNLLQSHSIAALRNKNVDM